MAEKLSILDNLLGDYDLNALPDPELLAEARKEVATRRAQREKGSHDHPA